MFVRKIRAASFMGAFLSFFVGACLAPFLWAAVLWVFHWLGSTLFGGSSPGVFHGLLDFVAAPNLGVGLIWLLYYIVGYIVALWRLSPREKAALRAQIFQSTNNYSWQNRDEEEEDDEGVDPLGLAPPVVKGEIPPQLYPGRTRRRER